ncbi:MAG: SCP2 sterol-binding domain-containing protein [Gammaproteobacteria bacterium]|nr:SCP2 sterol-binding domain-containing protein [Gammaproteobacteria bacterium]MDH5650781.1 SCP2 sterol-binding domain-containing protein [Gammaproteobacteria bacterium]
MSLFAELNGLFTAGLESAANTYLKLDPQNPAKLARLQGKVIAVHLRGPEKTFYLRPDSNGLLIHDCFEGEADATLSGSPLAFAELSLSDNGTRVMLQGEVQISGDLRLGQDFKRIMDEMAIDWEEVLSVYTGDVIAHKVGNLLRGFSDWGKNALLTTGQNIAEYLQQESLDLPQHGDVANFNNDVDTLRNDVDRLEARVKRLQQKLAP